LCLAVYKVMGAAGTEKSNLYRCLKDEFQQVAKSGCEYLALNEVLALRLPRSSWPVAFNHLGVLHALDRCCPPGSQRYQPSLDGRLNKADDHAV